MIGGMSEPPRQGNDQNVRENEENEDNEENEETEESEDQEKDVENGEVEVAEAEEEEEEEEEAEEAAEEEEAINVNKPKNTNAIQITSLLDDPYANVIELGDRIYIDSERYGRITGTVYYRDGEFISIKPDGISNTVFTFEVTQTDTAEEYNEEDGIKEISILKKRLTDSFIEQNDIRVDQIIDTFDASGELYKAYRVVRIDKDTDSITITEYDKDVEKQKAEEKAEALQRIKDGLEQEQEQKREVDVDTIDIEFGFIGIPTDISFKVISVREFVGSENSDHNNAPSVLNEGEGEGEDEDEDEGEDEGEDESVEFVGVIELVRPTIFKEAAAFEQRIPDNLQKIDALNDFISSLDSTKQKDQKSVREQRILMETFFNLKQSMISYKDDDSIESKNTSATTLSELIRLVPIPLGRPVLDVVKKVYYQLKMEEQEDEQKEEKVSKKREQQMIIDAPLGDTTGLYFKEFQSELTDMIEKRSNIVSSAQTIIKEWNDQRSFAEKYASTWTSRVEVDDAWRPLVDSDFFRYLPPAPKDDDIETENIPGYIPSFSDKKLPTISKVPFGIEVALATTYRKGADRKKQTLIDEEKAVMSHYVLFPLKAAKHIGAKRSYLLAIDSGRSQMPLKTMKMLLEKFGAPNDTGGVQSIILLHPDGNTLGNIPLADYIEGMSVPALGLGDIYTTLVQYGIDNMELNKPIMDVLLKKITLYQSQLLSTLSKLRTGSKEAEAKEQGEEAKAEGAPKENPFIENSILFEKIQSYDTLTNDIAEYERINPVLKASDIGKVIYLMQKHPNLFQVSIGTNSKLLAREGQNIRHTNYITYHKINKIIKNNQKNAGFRPKRNECVHVKDLVTIRKIFDDEERMGKLLTYFKKYQGIREENWINCKLCNEHLLCVHERLQLQAYLYPGDKATIEKEIILKFSGGQFQGKFICRNCGQAMREMDYDNNLEFDDDGKPKSGRAVLVDDDTQFDERLNLMLNASTKSGLKLSSDEMKCYDILRGLSSHLGIVLDEAAYKFIIPHVTRYMSTLASKDSYLESKKGKDPKKTQSYESVIALKLIQCCGAFLLIEIQTKIPDYAKHSTLPKCVPGFGGYPLATNGDIEGINYMTCAIISLSKIVKDQIWVNSGIAKVKEGEATIKFFNDAIFKVIQNYGDGVEVQDKLYQKRKYVATQTVKSSSDYPKDSIFHSFLPEQVIISPEEAAKDAIVPEVASHMGKKGEKALIKTWIRTSHVLAKATTNLVRGSPFIEATCCLASIATPSQFLKKSDLPEIGSRQLAPNQQGQMILTHFVPREMGSNVIEPDNELFHRLFLKCCFQGPRIGHSHETGLMNKCVWCQFQFPMNPAIMTTANIDLEGKSALYEQKIDVNQESFTELLDAIHMVNHVDTPMRPEVSPIHHVFVEFSRMNPAPLNEWQSSIPKGWDDKITYNWANLIHVTMEDLSRIPPKAPTVELYNALGFISDASATSKTLIASKLPADIEDLLTRISSLSWANFFQVLQTYIIVPLQRIASGFNTKSLALPKELEKELSIIHVANYLIPLIENDVRIIEKIKITNIAKNYPLALSKIRYFLKQMSQILSFRDKISPSIVVGKEKTLAYIQQILLCGPLAELLNSDIVPADYVRTGSNISVATDRSMKVIYNIVYLHLKKYEREDLSFDTVRIKELIEIRDEKERVNIVAQFDRLSDEDKAMELMNKGLGLGKWAVGGSKLIYAYDKDYFDSERSKRLEAGIFDGPGLEGQNEVDRDEYGFAVEGESEGYDHNQHGDDE